MQEVVRQLSERLVRLGHDVTVATSQLKERSVKTINGVKIAEFNISGNLVRGLTGNVREYEAFLLNSDFDVITNFAAQQWATDVSLALLDRISAKKIFVPTGFSGLYSPQYGEYFESMKLWMKKYDMSVFLSNDYRDINFARENGIKNTILIPNGAGEDEFLLDPAVNIRESLNIPDTHFLVLHVGSHTGQKGHSEAINIFRKAKIKNATLLLIANDYVWGCGHSCRRKAFLFRHSPRRFFDVKKLTVVSLSRKETVAAYKAADLFLFPSQIECSPLVLFECMASKTPFLTTDVGNAKEIIEWSGGGKILPTIKKDTGTCQADIDPSVEMFEDLYHHPKKRTLMRESGFRTWQERYTWERIAKDYESLYESLMRSKNEY